MVFSNHGKSEITSQGVVDTKADGERYLAFGRELRSQFMFDEKFVNMNHGKSCTMFLFTLLNIFSQVIRSKKNLPFKYKNL
jgi:hypothetical protein